MTKPLPDGVLVDDCFRAEVQKRSWFVNRRGYCRNSCTKELFLHRFIWMLSGRPMPEKPFSIDHINQDKLDNRLENLRVASRTLQALNTTSYGQGRKKANLPRGVYFRGHKPLKKPYQACIHHHGKSFGLGYHTTPEEASAAYEKKRSELMSLECSLSSPE
jgi:hypothetical protein